MLPFPGVLGIVKIVRAHFSIWYFLTFAAYSIWTEKIKLKTWKSSQMSRLFSLKILSHLSFISCFNIAPSLTLSLWFYLSFVLLVLIDPESMTVLEREKSDFCCVLPLQPMEKWFKAGQSAIEVAGERLLSLWKSPSLMGQEELRNENPKILEKPQRTQM